MEYKKLIVSWEAFICYAEKLCKEIEQTYDFDYVYGIPRGGLVLGTIISHYFNKPFKLSISPNLVDKVHRYLVVDDLVQTGTTLLKFSDHYNQRIKYRTAVIHQKTSARFHPDYVIEKEIIPDNNWIIYPYEKQDVDPLEETQKHLKKCMEICCNHKVEI